ncbi:MAG: LTA synthase family protein, partial [Tannerella sp.]|nr:LTA synthase family protein [Tannerella sp.]
MLLFLLFYFKILWFDFSWCLISTFRPFSYFETYLLGAIPALLLMLPAVVFRMTKTTFVLAVALGSLLLSNLIYFRTYYTAIPLSSYGLLNNMSGYTSSIFASLHWTDALFPISTIVALFIYGRSAHNHVTAKNGAIRFFRYFLLVFIIICLSAVLLKSKGGFKKCYEKLQDSYTHTCGPPIYTLLGSVYYDYIRDSDVYTPEIGEEIGKWLGDNALPEQVRNNEPSRMNCIIIFAESFES